MSDFQLEFIQGWWVFYSQLVDLLSLLSETFWRDEDLKQQGYLNTSLEVQEIVLNLDNLDLITLAWLDLVILLLTLQR